MKAIPSGSIDAVICDLPYGTTACKWDIVIPFVPLWEQYKRVCKPNAAIILFGAEPFSSALRLSNLSWYKYDYTWVKTKASGFQNAKIQPMRKHENIMVFYEKQPTFNQLNLVELAKPIESGRKRLRNEEQHRLGVAGKQHKTTHSGWQTSVLQFANPSGAGHLHPTQKPVDLIAYLVRTYTNEGDTVLDNCMGSGTTAIACIKEKRHFIGYELSKEYFDKAQKRIKAEQAQLKLF
jgi:site-specific DNA-methyltransferase (adenine-specific)